MLTAATCQAERTQRAYRRNADHTRGQVLVCVSASRPPCCRPRVGSTTYCEGQAWAVHSPRPRQLPGMSNHPRRPPRPCRPLWKSGRAGESAAQHSTWRGITASSAGVHQGLEAQCLGVPTPHTAEGHRGGRGEIEGRMMARETREGRRDFRNGGVGRWDR